MISGSQQQWMTRNSTLTSWSNGVWNQVFSAPIGAPAECFPAQPSCGGPYTTVAKSPVTREAPVLYADSHGRYQVFVPATRKNSAAPVGASGPAAGKSISIDKFFVAKPGDDVQDINNALSRGQNLIFTPGIYNIDKTIKVKRADTVVLGLGYATIIPQRGDIAMTVDDVPGVDISGVIFDAGPKNSRLLLQVGTQERAPEQPRQPDGPAGRVLPDRRSGRRQGHGEPRGQQRQHDPRQHLGLARRPRQRCRLDGQHRRHRA